MVGLAASPLWVSQGILITHFATLFAVKRGDSDGTAHVGFFNGIFSAFMVMTGVVGNLVSSFVFNGYNGACSGDGHSSMAGSEEAPMAVPQSAVDGLFSIYLFSTALAVLTATFTLPSMATIEAEREKYNMVDDEKVLPSLLMTVKLLMQPRMFLLAPIYASQGLIGAFLSANFTYDAYILAYTRILVLTNRSRYMFASSEICTDDPLLKLDPQEKCNRTESGRVQCWLRHGGQLRCVRSCEHFNRPCVRLARPALCHGICRELPLLYVCRAQILPANYIRHDVSC